MWKKKLAMITVDFSGTKSLRPGEFVLWKEGTRKDDGWEVRV